YGGKGLMRDWRGMYTQMLVDAAAEGTLSNPREIVSVPDFFERALPDDASSVWDHSVFQPDVILICIGQNDFNNAYIGATDYAQAYVKFIDRIHQVHPLAPIVIMSSPMAERSRTDGTQPRGAMHELALSLVQQHYLHLGESFVTPFFMAKNDGTMLDSHPIASQQRAMADELSPLISALMHW
ncbi:MAG: SGNH/GDSL hydrolase family protein, partial [Opitutales bacterium]